MFIVLDAVLLLCALALLVPLAVLTIECLAALLPAPREANALAGGRPACAVLVPAHDEESVLPATLDGLRRQLRPDDRLVVVADNCTDRTAVVARAAAAEVVERNDTEHRGKGYALAAGVDALRAGPPAVMPLGACQWCGQTVTGTRSRPKLACPTLTSFTARLLIT